MAKRPQKTTPPQKEYDTLTGTIRVHPRGFGFVVPDDGEKHPKDLFIPKPFIKSAIDGDRVEASINPDSKSEKGPDGKVLAILERGRSHVAGIISFVEEAIMAHVPLLGSDRPVLVKKDKKHALCVGDRLILKVLEWGDKKTPTVCVVSKKIGHIDDPSCDIKAAIEEHDLPREFPKNAIDDAKSFGVKVKKEELKGRLDLSTTPCITIDPETAKDFDDALSISKEKNGHFFLGVHIADVAHYIPAGSSLDIEARARSNSTYLPGTCIPMLPEELSNNLCSLRQGVIRLTVSVLMEFDEEGTLLNAEIKRTFIKSQKRYTYGEAKQILLDEKKTSPHSSMIHLMADLCLLLKKKRTERGSVDFALPELVLLIDKNGQPTGVKIEEYDITHQLVEEFMLKANEVVATKLSEKGKGLLFRVHEEPANENIEDFYATARALGFRVPPKPTEKDMQNLFDQAKDTPFSHQLAIGFIRNLKLALYSPENVGHYGLKLDYYCHFTSPIRRYSDLITERILFDEEGKDLNLEEIGRHCSDQERKSFKAEMAVRQLKKLRLLKAWIDDDPKRDYEATVTKVKPFGLFFEVKALFLEGYFHVSEIGNDYFTYEPKTPMMIGRATGMRYQMGTPISVQPVSVDLIHLEASWEIAGKKRRKR